MFRERLSELLTAIGADNGSIARYAGFDRTNISHMRGGRRVPGASGRTAEKLVNGIYLFSDNRNELGRLCKVVGASPSGSAEEIKQAVSDWLFEDSGEEARQEGASRKTPRSKPAKPVFRSFGERLDAIMTMTELSNIRLSRLVHIDASLISRYRNGVRSPQGNRQIASRMSHVLFERLQKNGQMKDLSRLMQVPEDMIDEEDFVFWLYQDSDLQDRNVLIAENLLEDFDSFTGDTGIELPSVKEAAPPEILSDKRTAYLGEEGLRSAVLRFLGNVLSGNAKELFLYSDEGMDWLISDREYLAKWASLMGAAVRNGTHIWIIHNIDRNAEELSKAISSWLPLYTSGMIESFYCKQRQTSHFNHTIFLAPGLACIEGFHVAGTGGGGIYHYHTGEAELRALEEEYRQLMQHARPLVRFGTLEPGPSGEEVAVIQSALTVASMPRSLAESFGSPELLKTWERMNRNLLEQLENGRVIECTTLAEDEELFAGKVEVDRVPGMEPVYYTPEQYAAHIGNIIRLSERYPGYCFYPLPETPFPNMKLLITETLTRVSYAARPELSFGVSHPVLCAAFRGFAGQLTEKNQTDRNTLRHKLERRYP